MYFFQEYNRKRAGRVAQVVVCLSGKHKALSSSPSTEKKIKIKKNITGRVLYLS
jgi:hypothetical protein